MIIRLVYTLKYLQKKQIFYQIFYRLYTAKRTLKIVDGSFINLTIYPPILKKRIAMFSEDQITFIFLNKSVTFRKDIDWMFNSNGLLWTFNLNYFDWLMSYDFKLDICIDTIKSFYSSINRNDIGARAYTTSIRILNLSKFICMHNVKDQWLYFELIADLKLLEKKLEYHIMANHLLENAVALYIGGVVTGQDKIVRKGMKLLDNQLAVQILEDGFHFERSPMYHLIVLERVLDALNFAKACNDEFQFVLEEYAKKMLAIAMNWRTLKRIPMFQDSAYNIAPSLNDIFSYGKELLKDLYPSYPRNFQISGYRILNSGNFKFFGNFGSISPSFQPGHSHADEFSFELFYKGDPVIVDTGVSTYETSSRRILERSTVSHNCISINQKNSSDVWSSFRVGRRGRVEIISETNHSVLASHNGFQGIKVYREVQIQDNESLLINDELKKNFYKSKLTGIGRIHIHPDVTIERVDYDLFKLNEKIIIFFDSKNSNNCIRIQEYHYAEGYNKLRNAKVILYEVIDNTKIYISEAS